MSPPSFLSVHRPRLLNVDPRRPAFRIPHPPSRIPRPAHRLPLMPASKAQPAKSTGRARIGDRLRRDLETLIVRYVDRLRSDPLFSKSQSLPNALLEDHAMSFLSDLFQSLVILENAGELDNAAESELLSDGIKIQRLVAELHGRQRFRLGWTEHALEREYQILREEVDSLVRRHAPDPDRIGDYSWAIEVLNQRFNSARAASVTAYEKAKDGRA